MVMVKNMECVGCHDGKCETCQPRRLLTGKIPIKEWNRRVAAAKQHTRRCVRVDCTDCGRRNAWALPTVDVTSIDVNFDWDAFERLRPEPLCLGRPQGWQPEVVVDKKEVILSFLADAIVLVGVLWYFLPIIK